MFKNLSTQALGIAGTQSEIIELALSHGFRGLDLDIVDFQRQVEARGLGPSRRLWDSAKLKFGRFLLPFDLAAEASGYAPSLAALESQAKLAAELGCTRCVTRIEPASEELPYHQNFEFHRKRIAEIAAVLAPHNVQLGVGFVATPQARQGKPFQFIYEPDPLLMLLGLVGKTNVGLALDLWDLHVAGKTIDDLRKLSNTAITLDVADFPLEGDLAAATEQTRLLPGESGAIDTSAALIIMAEKGYEGPVTPAPGRSRFTGQRREEVGRRAGQALDQVWKAAGLSAAGKLAPVRK